MKKINKKTIVISSIILVLIIVIVIICLILKRNNEEIIEFDDVSTWDGSVNLPINIQYDFDKKVTYLFLKNKKVVFDKEYELFDSFKNVSKNNIALNATKNDKKYMYIINLKGEVVKNITEMLEDKTNKTYSGFFDFENDHLQLYYISENICNETVQVEKIYVKTRNDKIEYINSELQSKTDFIEKYNYCS